MDMASFFGWLPQRCFTNYRKTKSNLWVFSLVPKFPATSPWGPMSKKLSCQNWLRHHLTHSFWMRSLALRPLNGMIGLQTPKQLRQVHPIADLSTGLGSLLCAPATFWNCRLSRYGGFGGFRRRSRYGSVPSSHPSQSSSSPARLGCKPCSTENIAALSASSSAPSEWNRHSSASLPTSSSRKAALSTKGCSWPYRFCRTGTNVCSRSSASCEQFAVFTCTSNSAAARISTVASWDGDDTHSTFHSINCCLCWWQSWFCQHDNLYPWKTEIANPPYPACGKWSQGWSVECVWMALSKNSVPYFQQFSLHLFGLLPLALLLEDKSKLVPAAEGVSMTLSKNSTLYFQHVSMICLHFLTCP